MRVEVTRYGVLPEKLIQKVETQFISLKDATRSLGEATRQVMVGAIEDSRQRNGSTGRLVNSIKVYMEDKGTVYEVGVGKIEEMNVLAPYWYLVNYGGLSGVAKHGKSLWGYYGTFIPYGRPRGEFRGLNIQGGKGATEKFTPMRGGYRMTPTAPIWPHNYIEKAANWASTIARVHYSGILHKVTIS